MNKEEDRLFWIEYNIRSLRADVDRISRNTCDSAKLFLQTCPTCGRDTIMSKTFNDFGCYDGYYCYICGNEFEEGLVLREEE